MTCFCGLGWVQAAPSRAETKAWNAACARFQDANSALLWSSVETNFAEFTIKYPASEHYSEAVLYHAQALFEQQKFDATINLLSVESTNASNHVDGFLYWTALSLARKGADEKAADTFARLAREHPESNLQPKALFLEAEAHSRMEAWKRVVEDLAEAEGPFQKFARSNPQDEMVVRGLLLLGRARFILKDYEGMEKTLAWPGADHWLGDSGWQRQLLLCRGQMERGLSTNALSGVTNLIFLSGNNADLKARSTLLQGQILKNLGRLADAEQAYLSNLDPSLPFERRKEALFLSIELLLQKRQVAEARKLFDDFAITTASSTNSIASTNSDVMLLLGAELSLKQYLLNKNGGPTNNTPPNGSTNLLQQATDEFQRLLRDHSNSPYLGKALLNLGWCQLESGNTNNAIETFGKATGLIPPSEDQAVAFFKLGDIAYRQSNYSVALGNYESVLTSAQAIPQAEVKKELVGIALYQLVRTAVAATNIQAAEKALKQLLSEYPGGQLVESGLVFVGQSKSPAESRQLFNELTSRFPQSDYVPQVRLATGRSFELEGDWNHALETYKTWLHDYPTNNLRSQAEFAAAMMTYKLGDESNAFVLFTNYVSAYQTNTIARAQDLPAQAQYWVGNYFMQQEDYQHAELNFEEVFNKWPDSPVRYAAWMMAGRAAFARQSPREARSYFTNLTSTTNCPEPLRLQAIYGLGDCNVDLANSTNTTNFDEAILDFREIALNHPKSELAPRAWGRLGDCYSAIAKITVTSATNLLDATETAMNSYTNARTSYLRAMESPEVTVRGQAELGLGDVEVEMANLTALAATKTSLRQSAFTHFLNVFDGVNLPNDQAPDLYYVGQAGLKAAQLAEALGDFPQAIHLYQRMTKTLPSLKSSLEKKIEKLSVPPATPKP